MLGNIQPGRPMQNGHDESSHYRLRDECLKCELIQNFERYTKHPGKRAARVQLRASTRPYRTPQKFGLKAGSADVESDEASSIRTVSTNNHKAKPNRISPGSLGVRNRRQVAPKLGISRIIF